MVLQSVGRLLSPSLIQYEQAMGVAALGLMVNLVCAWLLKDGHHHGHAEHDDLNLRSAYLHVVADAATSLLAIFALLGGMLWGGGVLARPSHGPRRRCADYRLGVGVAA